MSEKTKDLGKLADLGEQSLFKAGGCANRVGAQKGCETFSIAKCL